MTIKSGLGIRDSGFVGLVRPGSRESRIPRTPNPEPRIPNPRQDGIALILVLLSVLLVSALALGLLMTTSTELVVAAGYRDAQQTLHAAEAGLERAVADLGGEADWNGVLAGTVRSSFVDGPPAGTRNAAGFVLNLGEIRNKATCGAATCSQADITGVSDTRPWGPNNPLWQLYAWGPVQALAGPQDTASTAYVVVMVGDDPSETDGNPAVDGGGPDNPGAGRLLVRGSALGPSGAVRTVQATIERADGSRVRVLTWREVAGR